MPHHPVSWLRGASAWAELTLLAEAGPSGTVLVCRGRRPLGVRDGVGTRTCEGGRRMRRQGDPPTKLRTKRKDPLSPKVGAKVE